LAENALSVVMDALSQAILLYGAFEVMRGRPMNLAASARIGLRRFLPVLGVAIAVPFLTALASIFLIVPGVIVYTRWFVAMPACVVEGLGSSASMARSGELTKGQRWKVFGLWLAAWMIVLIVQSVLEAVIPDAGILSLIVRLVWGALWVAFYAIMVVVTYHD